MRVSYLASEGRLSLSTPFCLQVPRRLYQEMLEQARTELVPRTVLVLSNVSDPSVRVFVDATKLLCLVKPFEVADLLAMARRILRRVRAASASQ